MRADLHTHTTYSDGKLRVDDLIDVCLNHHITHLAITDHDSFQGTKEALSKKRSLEIIVGIELSTFRLGESVHILGYFKSLNDGLGMQEALDEQIKNRRKRAYKVAEQLKKHFDIDLDISFFDSLDSITRGSIAREIKRQGFGYTSKEIFRDLIGEGCPAYIPSSKMTTQEGIDLIHKNHGIAVIAHPANLKKNNVEDIILLGVEGLEGVYPNRHHEEPKFRALAKKHNLIITGGTDFHAFDDGQHGNIGDVVLKGEDLMTFLKVLYER